MSLGYLVNSTVFTTNRMEEKQSVIYREISKEILLKDNRKSEKFISCSDILDKVNDSKKKFESEKLNNEQTQDKEKSMKSATNQTKSKSEKKKVISSKLDRKNKNTVADKGEFKNNENNSSVSKRKVLRGKITAYTASKGAKTARGNTPRVGVCAMNLGRKVRLTVGNYSEDFTVDDTGGAFNRRGSDRILDIYMTDKKACYNWGVRSGYVEFLD